MRATFDAQRAIGIQRDAKAWQSNPRQTAAAHPSPELGQQFTLRLDDYLFAHDGTFTAR